MDLLIEKGFETKIHNQPELSEIEASGTWLIITSTHGAGEYPDNIQPSSAEFAGPRKAIGGPGRRLDISPCSIVVCRRLWPPAPRPVEGRHHGLLEAARRQVHRG